MRNFVMLFTSGDISRVTKATAMLEHLAGFDAMQLIIIPVGFCDLQVEIRLSLLYTAVGDASIVEINQARVRDLSAKPTPNRRFTNKHTNQPCNDNWRAVITVLRSQNNNASGQKKNS